MVSIPSEYRNLPTAEDLPDSDDTPVDNELQNDIPNLLLNVLLWIWGDRMDWFWGVDMGIYYDLDVEKPEDSRPIVPDGFLALGVSRHTGEGGRLSYVLWQEQVLPILALEVISKKYNGEYDRKLSEYQSLGVLYYVIYNPLSGRRGAHKQHQSLEVYKLVDGKYELMPLTGNMVWMPEVGLGIGCDRGSHGNWQREWVYWYDDRSTRYPTAEERAKTAEASADRERLNAAQERLAKQEAEASAFQEKLAKKQAEQAKQEAEAIAVQERQEKERLAAYLRSLGINPDRIS